MLLEFDKVMNQVWVWGIVGRVLVFEKRRPPQQILGLRRHIGNSPDLPRGNTLP